MPDFPLALLKTLPPHDLRRFAAYYQYLSETCLAFAREAELRMKNRSYATAHREAVEQTVDLIRAKIDNGISENKALLEVARSSQVPFKTIVARWRLHQRRKTKNYRQKRDLEIMRLRRSGLTNAEIGKKIGLSKSQTGRIIRRIEKSLSRTI